MVARYTAVTVMQRATGTQRATVTVTQLHSSHRYTVSHCYSYTVTQQSTLHSEPQLHSKPLLQLHSSHRYTASHLISSANCNLNSSLLTVNTVNTLIVGLCATFYRRQPFTRDSRSSQGPGHTPRQIHATFPEILNT